MKYLVIVVIFFPIVLGNHMKNLSVSYDDPFSTVQIAGGKVAHIKDFPYMVFLLIRINGLNRECGGSILTPRLVLTAAHCVKGSEPSGITAMINVTEKERIKSPEFPRYGAIDYKIHPKFHKDSVYKHHHYDIAVIILKHSINMLQVEYEAKAVTLAKRTYVGKIGVVSGYGFLADKTRSEVLMSLKSPVVSNNKCSKALNRNIDQSMLCAGYLYQSKGTWIGDSGSPLIIREKGKFIQIGVASWNRGFEAYSVYAGVKHVSGWIKEVISKYKNPRNPKNVLEE